MNAFVLKNLRKQHAVNKEEPKDGEEEGEKPSLRLPLGKYTILNININKFEKPVGAVIQSGGTQEIKDIIDIKKEEK